MPRVVDSKEERIFSGLKFFLLGSVAGYTKSKVASVIKEEGGTVTEDYTDDAVSRIIVSPIIWGAEGSVGASLILKSVHAANLANAEASVEAERDPDENRVWLLSFDWVLDSVRAGMLLDDEDFDWEKQKDSLRARKAKAAADERKRNGGFSKYRPGERAKKMREQEEKKELREMEREIEREKQDAEKKLRMEKEAKEKEEARRAAAPKTVAIVPDMPPMPEPLDLDLNAFPSNTATSNTRRFSLPYSSQPFRPPSYGAAPAQSTSTSTSTTLAKGNNPQANSSSFGMFKKDEPKQRYKPRQQFQHSAGSKGTTNSSFRPTDPVKKKINVFERMKDQDRNQSTDTSSSGSRIPVPAAKPKSSVQVPAKPKSSTQVPAKASPWSSSAPRIVLSDSSDSDVPIMRRTSSTSSTVPLKRKLSHAKFKSSSSEILIISDSDDGPTPKKART